MIPHVHTCVTVVSVYNVCAKHTTVVCDCSEEGKSEGFKERLSEGREGGDGKQLGGRGGESRDSEKSISAEYLIKFKPSDLSLLPGSKARKDTGERRGRAAGRRKGERLKETDA